MRSVAMTLFVGEKKLSLTLLASLSGSKNQIKSYYQKIIQMYLLISVISDTGAFIGK